MFARSFLPAKRIFRNENDASRPAPPPPRFARYASSSGPPPPLRGGGKGRRSRNAIRVGVLSRARRELAKSASLILTRHLLLSSLKIEGEAERRQTQIQPPRLRTARAQRSAHACPRSTAALT